MIPKIIHYCWMSGDPYPALIVDCMKTWKEKLPNYEFIEWNADSFDVNLSRFTKEAMECKKYAFVSDYVRLYALYKYGGIYLDCDIKVLKSFDDLLTNEAFTGFESNKSLGVWLLASKPNNIFFKEMLDCYKNKKFILDDGKYNITPNPIVLASIFEKYGIVINGKYQRNKYITVYPVDYFCPLDCGTGEINITNQTYAMHMFDGAWLTDDNRKCIELYRAYYQKYKTNLPSNVAIILSRLHANYDVKGLKYIFFKLIKFLYK